MRGHLPALIVNGGGDSLWKWPKFLLSWARDLDLDLGSGHTAHCHASLIDLYLRAKCRTYGRADGQLRPTLLGLKNAIGDGRLRPPCRHLHLANWMKHMRRLRFWPICSMSKFHNNFCTCFYGSGSVLLWRQCNNTLCASGFLDDIMFSHCGSNGPKSSTTLCFVEFARWRHRGEVAVYDCRLGSRCFKASHLSQSPGGFCGVRFAIQHCI